MAQMLALDPAQNRPTQKAAKKSTFRRDIQGLRAVAVLAVVADHLFAYPSGGFVGVDVFFVISGFLITGLLLKEHDRTGHISFVGFYRRRAKRILPASVLVLGVTAAFSYFLFNSGRALSVYLDAIWAFFFSANWRFASVGTDYFQAAGPVSPLQHFWSLAVEEQFYFVWPWLMLLIFVVVGRKAAGDVAVAHRAVGVAMSLIIVVSFFWAWYETTTSPTRAYFSTFSRAWELGIGALLAVGSTQLERLPDVIRPVLAWVGLAGIGISLFVVSADSMFPAPWAALPVLATAMVIAAGCGGEQRFLWPLTNMVSRYIGDVSYSLYLWHFPVIILLGVVLPEDAVYYAVAVVLMFALASASYHWVENPVRKSNWLDPEAAARAKRRRNNQGFHVPKKTQYVGLGVLAVLTFGMCAVALTPSKAPEAAQLPLANTGASAAPGAAELDAQGRLTASINEALQATAWPELTPSLDNLEAAKVAEWDQCLTTEPDELDVCSFGPNDATKTAFVLGDSVGISWLPGIRAALEPQGWRIQNLTMQQCAAADVDIVATNGNAGGAEIPGFNDDCRAHRAFVVEQAIAMQPDLVIMSNNLAILKSGAKDQAATDEWTAGYTRYIQEFLGATKKVVVLGLPPVGKNLAECATKLNKPSDCETRAESYLSVVSGQKDSAARQASSDGMEVTYVDPQLWLCSPDKRCPAFVGNTIVRADSLHLTDAYSKSLGPVLSSVLLGNPT